MRIVLQRVSSAAVRVAEPGSVDSREGVVAGSIGPGLLVLLGIGRQDTRADADYLIDRVLGLRIFADSEGKMNRSVLDAGGALLIVSQFTLYGDARRGRRPSFDNAAPPEQARELYEYFTQTARNRGVNVQTGVFQAMMRVELVNEGPVTILLDSEKKI